MTGFGRTGKMFGIEHESVVPDIVVLGKGLSGGYLPLAITLVSEKLFSVFDGAIIDGKGLAYGHSYTGNALGCVAAKASLDVFEKEGVLEALQPKIRHLASELAGLADIPGVVEVRQCGFIAGIEVAELSEAPLADQAAEICIAARKYGLLTRPIRNVIVLMPPLCVTTDQVTQAVEAVRTSIMEVCGGRSFKE
jgi:adenosylmethionine-8-amino-7-oxononanoate aminotransferase